MNLKNKLVKSNLLIYIAIIFLLVTLLFPLYWMIISSVTENKFLFSMPPQFWPKDPTLSSYIKIFQNTKYINYFKNSFIVSSGTVFVCLTVCILAGYSLSRFKFKGKKVAVLGITSVQMFPIVAILISLYTLYVDWHLLNTYQGLILANVTFCLPLAITLMKSFFDTLPKEMDESAKIDGAGRMTTLIRILLPLTLPGIVAVGIYTFLYVWDDFLLGLIIMQDDTMKTLTVGLAQSFMGEYAHDYTSLMAFSVAGSIPIVIMFIFFQKYFIQGLTVGAVKG